MNVDGWAWVIVNGDDATYWDEEAEFDRWMEAGSPPVEQWRPGEPATAPAMPGQPKPVAVPEIALTVNREQAAALLQVSVDHFRRHVLPELRVLQVGARQVVPVVELQDYVNRKSARALK